VSYGGPVSKADLGTVYSGWDALLLLIPGGRYVTAGKTYEYVATGLPIMSAHAADHGANSVLDGYPLWVPPPAKLRAELLAQSFSTAARLALEASDEQRASAAAFGRRFDRKTLLRPAVQALADSVAASGLAEGAAR
jgi:hypothetical protein